jgi:periplasmic protein TonB
MAEVMQVNSITMKKESQGYVEMLFENRNKEYGAYELRTNYEKRLVRSFGLALLVAACFFMIPYMLTQILTAKHKTKQIDEPVFLEPENFVFVKPEPVTPVMPMTPQHAVADAPFKLVQHMDDQKITDQKPAEPVPAGNDPAGFSPGISSPVTGDSNGSDSIITEAVSSAAVDVLPEFPGGQEAMMKFLKKNLRYTDEARSNGITGRIHVSFIVNEEGVIESVGIMSGLGFGMDEEVVRVIGKMPKWSPGKFHGRDVKTAFVMPVFFSLK